MLTLPPLPRSLLLCFQLALFHFPLVAGCGHTTLLPCAWRLPTLQRLGWVSGHRGCVLPRGKGLGFSLPSDWESLEWTGRVFSVTLSDFIISEGEWDNSSEMPVQDLSLEWHLKPNVVFWGKVAEGMCCWERESMHQLIELLFPGLFVFSFHTKSLSYACRGFLAVCSQCFCFTDGICLTRRISVNNRRPKSFIFILRANSVWLRVPEHHASMLKSNPQTPWDALDSSITVWTIPA